MTQGAYKNRPTSLARPEADPARRAVFDKNKKIILATQSICGICGMPVDKSLKYPHPMSPSVDHIIPCARGGSDDLDNLQLAHRKCMDSDQTTGIDEDFIPDFIFGSAKYKKFLSHTASLAASDAAMYSASMVESAMLDCLMLLQTTAAPPRVNTDPDVDFRESLSP